MTYAWIAHRKLQAAHGVTPANKPSNNAPAQARADLRLRYDTGLSQWRWFALFGRGAGGGFDPVFRLMCGD